MNAIAGLVSPIILGIIVMSLIWGLKTFSDFMVVIGAGYFVGWGLISILVLFVNIEHYRNIIYILNLIGILLFFIVGYMNIQYLGSIRIKINKKILFFCLFPLLLMIVRLVSLYAELYFMPVMAWDAWLLYLHRGIIWFQTYGDLVETTNVSTIDLSAQYDIKHYSYFFTSAIAFWMAIGIGEWDDALIFLPWFFCPLAAIIGIVGFLNKTEVSWPYCLVFSYIVLTIPINNAHIFLSGYLEIWLSSVIGIISACLYYMGSKKTSVRIYLFIIINILLCMIIKQKSGVIWSFNLILILIYYNISSNLKVVLLVLILSFCIIVGYFEFLIPVYKPLGWVVGFQDGILYGLSYRLKLEFDSLGLDLIIDALFYESTWNIFWYYSLGVVVYSLFFNKKFNSSRYSLLKYLIIIWMFEITLYLVTKYQYVGTNFGKTTSISRGFFQFYIAILLFVILNIKDLFDNYSGLQDKTSS